MHEPSRIVCVVLGLATLVFVLFDVFQSVLVPRPIGRRIRASAFVSRIAWSLMVKRADLRRSAKQREAILRRFAPLAIVGFFIFWATSCIVGFGLAFYGLRAQIRPEVDFPGALYFAGASLLTIGFGDIVPTGGSARLLAMIAGAIGLGMFAIMITYLFAISGSFQQRESFIVRVGERAGAPPSGVALLTTYARLGAFNELPRFLAEGQTWSAQLLETHLQYPVLAFYRSNHDSLSWVAVIGALLDASNLLLTACEDRAPAEAHFMLQLGRHVAYELSTYYGVMATKKYREQIYGRTRAPGVDRREFDAAHATLAAAGLKMRDAEIGYALFAGVRATYAPALDALATWLFIPPTQWTRDRSQPTSPHAQPVDAAIVSMIEKLEFGDRVASRVGHEDD